MCIRIDTLINHNNNNHNNYYENNKIFPTSIMFNPTNHTNKPLLSLIR